MTTWIALLRGINVGRAKQVAMADLREVLEGLGGSAVRTHLRSGNVVFEVAAAPPSAQEVERAVQERTGVSCSVLLVSADELAAIVAADPFGELVQDPSRYLVTFLSEAPDEQVVEEVRAGSSALAQSRAIGRAVYTWCPEGVLAAGGDDRAWARRGLVATARNWRTVTRLLELSR